MNHSLCVTAMLHNADDAAMPLVRIGCMLYLQAVLCQSPCSAVGLESVSSF